MSVTLPTPPSFPPRHLVDGLEPLDPKLSEFGLPDVTLWWKRAEKLRSSASESTNDVINEVREGSAGTGIILVERYY